MTSSSGIFCEASCCRGECHQLTLQSISVFFIWAEVAVIPVITSSCFPTTAVFGVGSILAVIFAHCGMNNINLRFRCKEETL